MYKYTKVCEICGKTFSTNDARRKTCSLECQEENKKRISREYNGFRYPLNYATLKIREVVNILITEDIPISAYIDNRDYYILKYFSCKELYYD